MTESQEKFLREFAEKLGWEFTENNAVIIRDAFVRGIVEWYDSERIKRRTHPYEWLLTPNGQAYLVNRAREEGYWVDTTCPPTGNLNVYLHGPDGGWAYQAHSSEPWATALAVAKALFGLEMEEG